MRLLFLSLSTPVPANNGHKMRTWSVLRALAAEGHTITLLTFASPADEFDEAAARAVCRHIIVVPLQMRNLTSSADYASRFLSLLSGKPYAIRRFASREMRDRAEAELNSGSYDAVICESAYAMVNLPSTDVPVILDNHNVEHLILQRYAGYERNPAKRWYASLEASRLRDMERQACSRASVSLCCSDTDCRQFASLWPNCDYRVVPNCIDVEQYCPDEGREQPETVLYQGGMDWFPNRDAVEFFIDSMLPRLRTAVPGVRFVIAGRNPSSEFRERLSRVPGVSVTGTVPDMRPLIAEATVCVVPLRIGSGTRLKILEAGAMGKAVVSTRVGAEGLQFQNGTEIMLADTPEDFANATSQLLLNSGQRAQLGRAARARVEQAYSFTALRQSVRSLFTDAGRATCKASAANKGL